MISFGSFEKKTLRVLTENIRKALNVEVVLVEKSIELLPFFDPSRRQYKANELLKMVDEFAESHHGKTIGLFGSDLYIPILTYIFGQARLGGKSGIASSYRLHNERYGLQRDHKLMVERFTKEILHEAGHTLGLIHCHQPLCVMQASTYVEDIDQKEASFCADCIGKVSWETKR